MGKRNVIRKLAGLSAVEAAKEEALRLHLQAALDNRPAPQVRDSSSPPSRNLDTAGGTVQDPGPKLAKKKRKGRQNRALERAIASGQAPESLPALVPHVRGFSLYCLGYKKADIARQLGVCWDTVADWEKAHGWEARLDSIQEEADRLRAVQVGAIRDLSHHTSVKILEHVADALEGEGAVPDAEDLRDYATAAEKAAKTVIPQEGAKFGVQVNIVDALAESRKYEVVEATAVTVPDSRP